MPHVSAPLTLAELQTQQRTLSVRLATVRRQVQELTTQATTQPLLTDEPALWAFAVCVATCAAEVRQILSEEAAVRRALTLLHVSEHPARDWRQDLPSDRITGG
jgi:hypothetical protein